MSDTFQVDAAVLPDDEVQSLSEQIAQHSQTVRSYRSTHYGWMDMEAFRAAYNRGDITPSGAVSHAMSCLRDLSGRMVYGFGRLAFSIATSFRAAPGTAKHDEYLSECLQAIDTCCYGYDGSNKFITYVTIAMQRRLINYKKRQRLLELTESELPQDTDNSRGTLLTNAEDERSNETEMVRDAEQLEQAITMAELSELERALIEAELRGVKGFRAQVAKQFHNPITHKPISLMAAGFAYQRALGKLRRALEKLSRAAA
jgi:hypothetical protein